MTKALCLFHVEDNEGDRRLLALAFDEQDTAVDLHAACDGEQAIAMLHDAVVGERCRPDLVILDLNLPKHSGFEVLAAIRRDPQLHSIRVAILTSSDLPDDVAEAEALGIVAYLKKPTSFEEFMLLAGHLLQLARDGRY